VEADVAGEQRAALSSLRFRHAAQLSEQEEAHGRELEQFRSSLELQTRLTAVEARPRTRAAGLLATEVGGAATTVADAVGALLQRAERDAAVPPAHVAALRSVAATCDDLQQTLDDVAALSRLEAAAAAAAATAAQQQTPAGDGAAPVPAPGVRPTPFDPWAVLSAVVDDATAVAAATGKGDRVTLSLEARGNEPHGWQTDARRFAQVASHLVGGALRHTAVGRVAVMLGLVGQDAGQRLRLVSGYR
jgi:signal transduction histidine kinase